jgi:hypothetical protein
LLTGIAEISAGHGFTCARTTGGTVRCWGQNGWTGQANPPDPKQPSVTGLANIVQVMAGGQHACALYATGTVSCWGSNWGQLGTGDSNFGITPTPVKGGTGVASLGLGNGHSCAVLTDRTVRCWGNNEFGGLGDGSATAALEPVAVRVSGTGPTPGVPSGPNLVPNGDFSSGMTGWQTTGVSNVTPLFENSTFCFGYGDGGAGTLGTTGPLALVGGVRYEFTFRVSTTVDTGNTAFVRAKVGEAAPPYGDYTTLSPTVTATSTTHRQVFSVPADVTAGVAFITSATWHGSTCIDDVVVRVSHE